jgi:anion-transporting  ArsA/GET3 family ATPase
VAFFQAFEGMEDGFRSRASAVHEILRDPETAYVLVTSARPDAIVEASFFADKLRERDVSVAALVINRIAPWFGDGDHARRRSGVPDLEALEENLAALNAVAAREEVAYSGLAAQVAPAPVGKIPLFGDDVHELVGLRRAADYLFGDGVGADSKP